jgi:hypothetical protein
MSSTAAAAASATPLAVHKSKWEAYEKMRPLKCPKCYKQCRQLPEVRAHYAACKAPAAALLADAKMQ